MCIRLFAVRAVAAVALTLLPALARSDDVTCDFFISAAPFTATAQGHYCLANNIAIASSSGIAITIDANSVVLDLKGYKIGGQAAGLGTGAAGVFVNNRSNVIVRNGLIRGFYYGVVYVGGSFNNNNIVENINADSNTAFGIYVGSPGSNNTIRNCVVGSTGGSTTGGITMAIVGGGVSAFVTNCTVTNTFLSVGGDYRLGIWVPEGGRSVNNQVIGDGGITGTNICQHMNGGVYKDNIVSGCITSYSGSGTAVGTTNYP